MRPLEILTVMDPPATVDPARDTTFALFEEAHRRGHVLEVCDTPDLSLRGAVPLARSARVTDLSRSGPALTLGPRNQRRLADFDLVLMRKDPPTDLAYLQATLVLERARGHTLVLNDPRGLREANEKLAILEFPELVPPTVVTSSPAELRTALSEFGEMVIKPLERCGGSGVFHVSRNDRNAAAIAETATCEGRSLTMAQRYLPEVRDGDKRILLLDGEPLGAILRVPRPDEARANLHVGGTARASSLTRRDREVCTKVGAWCRSLGLALVGLDVIGGHLTEINVTSPTGVQELAALSGGRPEACIVDWLERRCMGALGYMEAAAA